MLTRKGIDEEDVEWEIQIKRNGEVVQVITSREYIAVMTEQTFHAEHKDKSMIDKLNIVGMGGKFLELIGHTVKAENAPFWWQNIVFTQAEFMMLLCEVVSEKYALIPTLISGVEYNKLLAEIFGRMTKIDKS